MKTMNFLGEVEVGGKKYKLISKSECWWHVYDEEKKIDFVIRPPDYPALSEEIRDKARIRELLINSNVPELFIEEVLKESIRKTPAIRFLFERKEKLLSGNWAYLYGAPGVGKTFACVYFLYRYIRKYGRAGYFIFCPTHDFKAGSWKEAKEQADIFILDDFVLEIPQWQLQEAILFLLDTYGKPTKTVLITSNVSFEKFANAVGDERLISRLIQKTRGCRFKVEGEDLRVKT